MPFGDCKRRNLSMDRADRRTWPFNRELLDNSHNEVRKIPSAPIATLFPLKTGQPLSTVAAHHLCNVRSLATAVCANAVSVTPSRRYGSMARKRSIAKGDEHRMRHRRLPKTAGRKKEVCLPMVTRSLSRCQFYRTPLNLLGKENYGNKF